MTARGGLRGSSSILSDTRLFVKKRTSTRRTLLVKKELAPRGPQPRGPGRSVIEKMMIVNRTAGDPKKVIPNVSFIIRGSIS